MELLVCVGCRMSKSNSDLQKKIFFFRPTGGSRLNFFRNFWGSKIGQKWRNGGGSNAASISSIQTDLKCFGKVLGAVCICVIKKRALRSSNSGLRGPENEVSSCCSTG